MVCGWVEVCIRKEDVVLLSRKGRGCLVCGRNMQVFWMLVFYYRMICPLVNDSSQGNGYGPSRVRVVFAGRCENAVMRVPNRATGKNISVLTKKQAAKQKLSGLNFSNS